MKQLFILSCLLFSILFLFISPIIAQEFTFIDGSARGNKRIDWEQPLIPVPCAARNIDENFDKSLVFDPALNTWKIDDLIRINADCNPPVPFPKTQVGAYNWIRVDGAGGDLVEILVFVEVNTHWRGGGDCPCENAPFSNMNDLQSVVQSIFGAAEPGFQSKVKLKLDNLPDPTIPVPVYYGYRIWQHRNTMPEAMPPEDITEVNWELNLKHNVSEIWQDQGFLPNPAGEPNAPMNRWKVFNNPLPINCNEGDVIEIDALANAFTSTKVPPGPLQTTPNDIDHSNGHVWMKIVLSFDPLDSYPFPSQNSEALLYSLDIGSDSEFSEDLHNDANSFFDPGDLYFWFVKDSAHVDGFMDDADAFSLDPAPNPGDATSKAPLCDMSVSPDPSSYLDVDGADCLDIDLLTFTYGPGHFIPAFDSYCIWNTDFIQWSFDEDSTIHFTDVPCDIPSDTEISPLGNSHEADEVFTGITTYSDSTGKLAIYAQALGAESDIDPDLWPNPDTTVTGMDSIHLNDDIDALDVMDSLACTFNYFSVDNEATYIDANGVALAPNSIYLQTPPNSHVKVIDGAIHLGLNDLDDLNAFEFAWLPYPSTGQNVLALVFSVDPIGSSDLSDNKLYASFLDGTSFELTNALDSILFSFFGPNDYTGRIDALSFSREPILPLRNVSIDLVDGLECDTGLLISTVTHSDSLGSIDTAGITAEVNESVTLFVLAPEISVLQGAEFKLGSEVTLYNSDCPPPGPIVLRQSVEEAVEPTIEGRNYIHADQFKINLDKGKDRIQIVIDESKVSEGPIQVQLLDAFENELIATRCSIGEGCSLGLGDLKAGTYILQISMQDQISRSRISITP